MTESFQLTKVAASMSMILGGSLMLAPSFANTCTTFSAAGTCGLTEYQMTSKLDPVPTAWYFTQPTQDAAINGQAKKQNIHFTQPETDLLISILKQNMSPEEAAKADRIIQLMKERGSAH